MTNTNNAAIAVYTAAADHAVHTHAVALSEVLALRAKAAAWRANKLGTGVPFERQADRLAIKVAALKKEGPRLVQKRRSGSSIRDYPDRYAHERGYGGGVI